MNKKSVLIGLSGGVDSSIAAYLLKKQGYEVKAIFLKMFSTSSNKECSWIKEYRSAQRISNILDIPLKKVDFEKTYREKVLKPMFLAYKKGKTPNPDISCNTIIKFPLLWKLAKQLDCQYIATGHYARIKKDKNSYHLLQGKDKTKDQSYFLSELTQKDLQHTLFPVGNLSKKEVRALAKKLKFPNHDKESTKGLCFIGGLNFQSFLKNKLKAKPGKVKDNNNNTLGEHQGSHYYTLGQKASSSIKIKKPNSLASKRYYIYKKKGNTIYVAPEGSKELFTKEIKIKKLRLINKLPKRNLKARIRHLGKLHSGTLKNSSFHLKKPIELPAPGQFLVLYSGSELIGSAEIR